MIIVELIINTHDAMGANVVNTMCEAVGQAIESITGCRTILKILSNYSVRRLVRCRATFSRNQLGGDNIVERILYAYALAYSDVYRAVTHNKGIMNGIDAVALATGQDFRAIEARPTLMRVEEVAIGHCQSGGEMKMAILLANWKFLSR